MAEADEGFPEPLGVTLADGGANVAIPAPGASDLRVCLFDAAGNERRQALVARTGDVFHGFVPGLVAGTRYGLRASGTGARFNPAKLLLDPWATRLDRGFVLHAAMFDGGDATDSAPVMPKAVAEPPLPKRVPARRPGPHVIYELHVRGFTMRHPEVPAALRGTFAGLAQPAPIAHLKRLGVTLVELMPAAAWIDERHLPPLNLTNYWGYNPVSFLAPDPRLAPGGMKEVRAAVAALQEAGIGVILDVVLNHTGEGDAEGPTLSLRGLGNRAWYRMRRDDPSRHVDDTGCGNTLALDRPWALRLAMDALRHWAEGAGVDGFRLDLATTLGRRECGFDPAAPLLAAIRQDPVLRTRRIIAEPWDPGPDGYRLGAFPPGWGEWNDRFRDEVRKFWRGDGGMLGPLATRLAGSADRFAAPRPIADSINFITAHDGFTLRDLVSFTARRNAANGEQGRDGAAENFSWNGGAEGETDDQAILARRTGDVRALLATLLLARGTPMLAMGDEAGRSQAGNNNAYCHDSPLTWFDWEAADQDLIDFTAALIAARRRHPALCDPHALTGEGEPPDVAWLTPDSRTLAGPDWATGRALVAVLFACDDRAAIALNGETVPVALTLPPARWGFMWQLLAASTPAPAGLLGARSVQLWTEVPLPPPRRDSPDGATLARLAAAAGIATHWHDVSGVRHAVPVETVRALLAALGLPHATRPQARESLARCFLPADLAAGARSFGISAQTYALRHARDQGIGDFTALAELAAGAAAAGARYLGFSPPHALMPTDRSRASPYQPGDRRMLEPALLDVSGLAPDQDFSVLRGQPLVEYAAVWAAKRAVLQRAWRALPADDAALRQFRIEGGATLERFATFTAIAEFIGHTDIERWPAGLRSADGDAVQSFAAEHRDAIGFHVFLQFLCDQQLAHVAAQGIGLYRDLAVGAAPDGAEAWAGRDLLLGGFSIGAPPDPLGPLGQVWGLPPPNPRAPGMVAAFGALVRANMRHAAALRIDHVMQLARLFVIPEGAPGSAGCYLSYPLHALLDALAAASCAQRCLVVGEDLGTVPEGFAETLQAADILSYRVLWFEHFRAPAEWPVRATACVSTHDLPPLAGWWEGADISERRALGLLDAAGAAAARAARAADRKALMRAIGAEAARAEAPFDTALARSVHAYVAATPSVLMLAQADDLAGARIATNLPGTDRERPNWRRRLAGDAEALTSAPLAQAILSACAAGRR